MLTTTLALLVTLASSLITPVPSLMMLVLSLSHCRALFEPCCTVAYSAIMSLMMAISSRIVPACTIDDYCNAFKSHVALHTCYSATMEASTLHPSLIMPVSSSLYPSNHRVHRGIVTHDAETVAHDGDDIARQCPHRR